MRRIPAFQLRGVEVVALGLGKRGLTVSGFFLGNAQDKKRVDRKADMGRRIVAAAGKLCGGCGLGVLFDSLARSPACQMGKAVAGRTAGNAIRDVHFPLHRNAASLPGKTGVLCGNSASKPAYAPKLA